jgi:hypothetical protein
VEDAPYEIAAIKEDLRYLISVVKKIETNEHPSGQCIAEGAHHCQNKIAVRIVRHTRVDVLMM